MSNKKKKGKWKKKVKQEQDYICPVCDKKGTTRNMNIHHIINKCRGGTNERSNCVAVHRWCHQWIHETYGNNTYDPRKH